MTYEAQYGCGACNSTLTVKTDLVDKLDSAKPTCICGTNVPMYERFRHPGTIYVDAR